MTEIHVFRTNLFDQERINDIGARLNCHPQIMEWNVDLHDVDFVLRVVTVNVRPGVIESILASEGYFCEALP